MEARAVARLNSQHVVRIFDMGVMDLKHYIAMEYVTGGDLRTAIGTMKRMPLKDALRVFVQIAEGLGAAHEAGIVHRDIKPGNVLLTDYGDVRLVDFGLAQLDNAAGQTPEIVASLRTAGTPGFMAPEQIRGETVGPPADIYALGITLFHMLVGMPPFRVAKLSAVEDVVQYTLEGKLPTMGDFVPGLPPAIEQLYRYCTATAVGDRFREVNAFLPTARQWLSAL
jgi:serine/threonine-protein kinase